MRGSGTRWEPEERRRRDAASRQRKRLRKTRCCGAVSTTQATSKMLDHEESDALVVCENAAQNGAQTAAPAAAKDKPSDATASASRKRSKAKKRANAAALKDVAVAGASMSRLPVPAWLQDVEYVNDPVIPVATRLGQEMLQYCEYSQRVMENLTVAIEDAVWSISECVQRIWPEATVTCFGSFSSGLWLPSSDVDVVVMGIPTMATSTPPKPAATTPKQKRFAVPGVSELEQIAASLREEAWVKQIEVVKSAKVPVAKLQLVQSDLRVDISIENAHTLLGIEASALVREYITAIPVLHPLIMVLKQFLREKGLNNAFTGGLSSYCISLMAFYLVERQHATNYAGSDVGQLLLDFLEFYGTIFSFATTGISLKAEAFGEYFLDPSMMLTSVGANGVPLLMPQLVIDDPVYPDGQHNAAAGAFAIARVIAAFENAFYAVSFHRATKFTPSPLSQLLHWSGYGDEEKVSSSSSSSSSS